MVFVDLNQAAAVFSTEKILSPSSDVRQEDVRSMPRFLEDHTDDGAVTTQLRWSWSWKKKEKYIPSGLGLSPLRYNMQELNS